MTYNNTGWQRGMVKWDTYDQNAIVVAQMQHVHRFSVLPPCHSLTDRQTVNQCLLAQFSDDDSSHTHHMFLTVSYPSNTWTMGMDLSEFISKFQSGIQDQLWSPVVG